MFNKTHHVKVVVVGDSAVGKTTLIQTLCDSPYDNQYIPTVFDNHNKVHTEVINGEKHALHIGFWDTAGALEFDRLRPLSYPQTDIFLFCFDVTKLSSLQNIRMKWVPEIDHHDENANTIRILMGLRHEKHRKYDHRKLVFGYVRRLHFYEEMNIMDDMMAIIWTFESGEEFNNDTKFVYPSDELIEETRLNCKSDALYFEVCSKEKVNISNLMQAIATKAVEKDLTAADGANGKCCIVL